MRQRRRNVAASKRNAEYAVALLRDLVPPTCLKVHLCGEAGAGKTHLSSALRRSWMGATFRPGRESARDVPAEEDPAGRTRGIEVPQHPSSQHARACERGEPPLALQVKCGSFSDAEHRLERAFSFWDYGGQPEFHLGHHNHLIATNTPAVYVIVTNASRGRPECMRQLRFWLRFIAAGLPSADRAVVALAVSRADAVTNASDLVTSLQNEANNDAASDCIASLPLVVEAFALDCRKYASVRPLRDWLVGQHSAILRPALPLPRACEAIEACKAAWLKRVGPALRWESFVERCHSDATLPRATEALLRTAASFLHDSGSLVALDKPEAAAEIVILDPTWLCSLVVGQLLAPEHLHRDHALRKPLLSSNELEQITMCSAVLGSSAGNRLGELLCGLGFCFRVQHTGHGAEETATASFFLPSLLTSARPHNLLLRSSTEDRTVGRRLLGRTPDVMLVPGFFPRLQVRVVEARHIACTTDTDRVFAHAFHRLCPTYRFVLQRSQVSARTTHLSASSGRADSLGSAALCRRWWSSASWPTGASAST